MMFVYMSGPPSLDITLSYIIPLKTGNTLLCVMNISTCERRHCTCNTEETFRFRRNSEADASEFVETLEEIYLPYGY